MVRSAENRRMGVGHYSPWCAVAQAACGWARCTYVVFLPFMHCSAGVDTALGDYGHGKAWSHISELCAERARDSRATRDWQVPVAKEVEYEVEIEILLIYATRAQL